MVDNIPVHVDPARPPAPTLEQVAERAGVSRSTASRAINGGLRVSPEALASVEAAVTDLGYTPNRAARSLVTKRTDSIALVVPEPDERVLSDPFFAGTLNGLSTSLEDSDMQVVLVIARPGESERTVRYLRNGHVDGAIVVSHHTSDTFIDRIASVVPVVYGGRPVRERERDYYVDVDNVRGAYDATVYLIESGRRRIGTITGPLDMPAGIDRLQGYRDAITAWGLSEGVVEDGNFTADGGADAMRRILESGERPDAVFVASDLMAQGAMTVLAAAGLRVPDDIALIGFDDSPVATSVSPQLTTVRQPSYSQGERMASILLELLAGRHPRHVTILETELVVRESV